MKKYRTVQRLCSAATAGMLSVFCISSVRAADPAPGVIGKDGWLFYSNEVTDASHIAETNVSLDLIKRLNKVLATNGVNLVVVMIPLKMRIYSEFLPDEIKINDYMASNYDRMSNVLRAANVNTADLNTAFGNSPKRISETPLFFRLDTHWTPTGAMLAAETIKAAVIANPVLRAALDATPEESFKLAIANRKRPSRGRDLVGQLPKNTITFAPEMVAQVNITRVQAPKEDLLGNRMPIGLALVGSSYSMDWTGFSDALRYTLQRDILSVAVTADKGSWVGVESYLRDDAFQTKAPKILFWEMPERDMRASPDYRFREASYISDNTEWLLRASAWVQASCKPSAVTAKLMPVGLAANAVNLQETKISTGPTSDEDFIEISFDKPVKKLDYLSALATTAGSKSVILEASGPGVSNRRFTMTVPGDDAAHAFRMPLPSAGAGFTKVRVFPGKSNAFIFDNLKLCQQPEDILK